MVNMISALSVTKKLYRSINQAAATTVNHTGFASVSPVLLFKESLCQAFYLLIQLSALNQ